MLVNGHIFAESAIVGLATTMVMPIPRISPRIRPTAVRNPIAIIWAQDLFTDHVPNVTITEIVILMARIMVSFYFELLRRGSICYD